MTHAVPASRFPIHALLPVAWVVVCMAAAVLGSDVGFAVVFFGSLAVALAVLQYRHGVPFDFSTLKGNAPPAPVSQVFDVSAAQETGTPSSHPWLAGLCALALLAFLSWLVTAAILAARSPVPFGG